MALLLGAAIVVGAMDAPTASIVVAAFSFAGIVVSAVIAQRGNSSRENLALRRRHRRDQRRIRALLIKAGVPPEAIDEIDDLGEDEDE